MTKCDRCGRFFFSANRFQTLEYDGKNLLVCPVCIKERRSEVEGGKEIIIENEDEQGGTAEQNDKEIEEKEKQNEKYLWLRFIIVSISGLISASYIIIQLNMMFNRMNEFNNKNGPVLSQTASQTELIQKIIGIDIGVSLIIIAGFWLCYIFVKNKEPKNDLNFDAFEETKKNKKIPVSILLMGIIITLISFVFL